MAKNSRGHGTERRSEADDTRAFWSRVEKGTGCWNWTAGFNDSKDRYGTMDFRGKKTRAHRISFELHHGPIPKALHVLHKCDNPSCVRPDHLFLGTNHDNILDCAQKGRTNRERGAKRYSAKLTEESVSAIKLAAKDRKFGFMAQTARDYGVTENTIRQIVTGKRWKHVA